ncbi:hypothetical protein HZH68_015711 [Vespula germanica]|uniref:Uncharacterized protein n=1 Tax=Vespula germanica TaxID=30212 RepID=A0A834J4M4_VESGE|nr:hypothetical protein HZH68_015711 [Vespula germanica]
METRSGVRRINDAEVGDITLRLRQKELLLQERERTICEREEILRADTVQPDLATLETLREIVTMRQHANDAYYNLRESHNIFIQRTINMNSPVELNSIYMDQDEYILDFTDRMKYLYQAICDEERYGTYELTENKRNEIEFTLTSNFCDVLSLEHSLKINPDMCENLLDAFAKARQFYTRIEQDRIRYKKHRQSQNFQEKPTTSNRDRMKTRDRNKHTINLNPLPKTCTYYNKLRHIKEECYRFKRKQLISSEKHARRDYSSPRSPVSPNRPQSESYGPRKECRYCKNLGHMIEGCRKKLWHDRNWGNAITPPKQGTTSEMN